LSRMLGNGRVLVLRGAGHREVSGLPDMSERQHCAVGDARLWKGRSSVAARVARRALLRFVRSGPLTSTPQGHARARWARAIDLLFITASGLVIESVDGRKRMTRLTRIGGRP
jgi:hypothetical protein